MRHDLVRRGVGFDAERGVGQQSDLGGWRLLHLAVWAAVDIVLPHGEIALLCQRMRNRATRARIILEKSARAPVICVAVSHRAFGRPLEDGGSCR